MPASVQVHGRTEAAPASCLFHVLNSASAFDPLIGAARTTVLFRETRDADGAPSVQLWPGGTSHAEGANSLTLGHQEADGLACPATVDYHISPSPSLNPRLAAVALAVDESRNHVLLTRRPRGMRTFPGAWVLPGGGVDASDVSLCAAATRELLEEVGISTAPADASAPVCCWESCYPTSYTEWSLARAAGARCIQHLVVYYMVPIPINSVLKLDPIECDCAVWAPLSEIESLLGGCGDAERLFARAPGVPEGEPISGQLLRGVYPNALGEGIARGHLFALSQLVQSMRAAPLRFSPASREHNHL